MKYPLLFPILILLGGIARGPAQQGPSGPPDGIVTPSATNAVQFRLYTNAAPDSPHLFNTFELEAYGEKLLQSPAGDVLQQWLASPSKSSPHNLLVNGEGPTLGPSNNLTLVEQASGPDWRYLAWDGSAAYRGRLDKYKRGLLFVEPDLFILYDRLVAKDPVSFQMLLHPPTSTQVDTNWGDLHLALPKAGLTVHAPGRRGDLRSWKRIDSTVDKILPGTATLLLGPTNKLAEVDLLTIFAVPRGGEKRSYAFKLLLSNSAVGARIHRDGLPTLIAFKTADATATGSLTGFGFNGPVGVDVFKPKQKKAP